jgi:hypothetical protein
MSLSSVWTVVLSLEAFLKMPAVAARSEILNVLQNGTDDKALPCLDGDEDDCCRFCCCGSGAGGMTAPLPSDLASSSSDDFSLKHVSGDE